MTIRVDVTEKGDFQLIVDRGRSSRFMFLSFEELELLMQELSAHVEPRDRHHTMRELYEYRLLYNAHAANEWAKHGTYPVVKSYYHHDGELCFGGGWFIVTAELPSGQVSNHYKNEDWDLFNVPAVDRAPEWDGHTPAQASARLLAELML